MYSAITKPHRNGDTPADVERLHTDEDLRAFLQVAKTYAPTCLQVELARQAQSEPPDVRPFFPVDVFGNPEPAAQYDPPVSDSENDRYIRACGKAKRKMWPKSDKVFEHQKAMTRKRIRRLQGHLAALKQKHKEFYGATYDEEVIDTDAGDPKYFTQTMWLNPQSGAQWVEGWSAVINAIDHTARTGKTRGAWI